jgi:hypothetical protein
MCACAHPANPSPPAQVQLRLWFPQADLGQLLGSRPSLLSEEEFSRIPAARQQLLARCAAPGLQCKSVCVLDAVCMCMCALARLSLQTGRIKASGSLLRINLNAARCFRPSPS